MHKPGYKETNIMKKKKSKKKIIIGVTVCFMAVFVHLLLRQNSNLVGIGKV